MKEDSTEILPLADKHISALLQSLPRVESTGSFEANVRGRIEDAKAVRQRTWLVPSFAIAIAIVHPHTRNHFLAISKFADLAAIQSPTEMIDTVPKSPFVEAVLPNDERVAPAAVVSPEVAVQSVVRKEGSVERAYRRIRPMSRPVARVVEGGSVDRGVSSAPMINANVGSSAPVPLKDYFPMIGLDATFENSGWTVRKVTPDSVADRAGVIDGDIVESIGSVRLAEKTSLNGSELESKITVRRGNELKTLDRGKP